MLMYDLRGNRRDRRALERSRRSAEHLAVGKIERAELRSIRLCRLLGRAGIATFHRTLVRACCVCVRNRVRNRAVLGEQQQENEAG